MVVVYGIIMSVVPTEAEGTICEASTIPIENGMLSAAAKMRAASTSLDNHARTGSLDDVIDELPVFLHAYNNSASAQEKCIRLAASQKEQRAHYQNFVGFHAHFAQYITIHLETCKDLIMGKCQRIIEDYAPPTDSNRSTNERMAPSGGGRTFCSPTKRRRTNDGLYQSQAPKIALVRPFSNQPVQINTETSMNREVVDVIDNAATFLGTAVVEAMNSNVFCADMRCLCDASSPLNLITSDTVRRLRLAESPTKIELTIGGIGGDRNIVADGFVKVQMAPHYGELAVVEAKFYVVGHISRDLPVRRFPTSWLDSDMAEELADINFNCPGPIDAVLGVNVWAAIIQPEIRTFAENISAQRTRFGWVVFGALQRISVNSLERRTEARDSAAAVADAFAETTRYLTKLWERQALSKTHLCIRTETECVDCSLPHCPLTDENGVGGRLKPSREDAANLFLKLEHRLSENPELKIAYIKFMQDCIASDRMRLVNADDEAHYMPHHCVIMSRKFRTLFSAPHPIRSGLSVHSLQMIGKRLHDEWPAQLLRFRSYEVAITARLAQKDLNRTHPDVRNDQRIFWRESPNNDLLTYEFNIETDEHARGPHCAVRALRQCAFDWRNEFPLGSFQALNCCYMDRYFGGGDTQYEAHGIIIELRELLSRGGLVPLEFCSNVDDVGEANEDIVRGGICCEDDMSLSVVGLHWMPVGDYFAYTVKPIGEKPVCTTTRQIVAELERFYDPCGLLAPVIITAKLLMQEMCNGEAESVTTFGDDDDDDDEQQIAPEIHAKWVELMADLLRISEIKVPRWLATSVHRPSTLVGFCSASEVAFAAVVYARTKISRSPQDIGDDIVVALVQADSRVAHSNHSYTEPQMHLLAAQLLAELMTATENTLCHEIFGKHYWSGSVAALSWIRGETAQTKGFEADCVNTVQQMSDRNEWRHVDTCNNPATFATKTNNKFFQNQQLWYNGPDFVRRNEYWRELDFPASNFVHTV